MQPTLNHLSLQSGMSGLRMIAGELASGAVPCTARAGLLSTSLRRIGLMMILLISPACTSPNDYIIYTGAGGDEASGPWSRIPGIVLSQENITQQAPAGLLRFEIMKAISDQFLRLEGATSCDTTDPLNRKPVRNLTAEYCSALYVVNISEDGQPPTYELRLTTPRRNLVNPERGCFPPQSVKDADYPVNRITLIGLLHNHPCWRGPSTPDMAIWPMDFDATQGMARLDLYPGNSVTGEPPIIGGSPIVAQSFIFARKEQHPIYLLLRSTGDVHEWSGNAWEWRTRCEPEPLGSGPARCAPLFNPGRN
ncbi:hypothetical protein [Melittangium boletus]|uniref:Uncharacterized protein n=1 Tax=Melittangium boletus DSM 14713 TaxID=1294270 RepID=A0A250IIN1_9BACT|nr:hypothetical protein [Melittangium boletus]ATB31128.1 hypothetical protein MEBOL_004590 [Melittangium boletus DSM 14713]